MELDLYQVIVSSLEIRNEPDMVSKVYLKRNTFINNTGYSVKYKGKEWVKVTTINKPVLSGYVLKKFIRKV